MFPNNQSQLIHFCNNSKSNQSFCKLLITKSQQEVLVEDIKSRQHTESSASYTTSGVCAGCIVVFITFVLIIYYLNIAYTCLLDTCTFQSVHWNILGYKKARKTLHVLKNDVLISENYNSKLVMALIGKLVKESLHLCI